MAGVATILPMALAGASVASDIVRSQEQAQAEAEQEQQINLQMQQQKAAASQQAIARDKKIQQVESSQRARAVSAGMDLSSGTLSALQDNSYNSFAQDTNAANINLSSEMLQDNERIDAARSQLHSQLWGNLFQGLGSMGSMISFGSSATSSAGQNAANAAMTGVRAQNTVDQNNEFMDTFQKYGSPQNEYESWLRKNSEWTI